MTEYRICEAVERGYAKKFFSLDGQPTIVCNLETCPENYKRTIHLDAEPVNICLVNGLIKKRENLQNLIQKKPFEKKSVERITIRVL